MEKVSIIVNIILCILSFILALISVITVIITIRQNSKMLKLNNKMIENSVRPYVDIYFDYTQMGSPTGYFIVKNFGSSSAMITSLSYNEAIKNYPNTLSNLSAIFDGLVNNAIAPNQKFIAPFKLPDYTGEIAIFDITYTANDIIYTNHIEININNYGKLVKPRRANEDLHAITYPLQEIAERLM